MAVDRGLDWLQVPIYLELEINGTGNFLQSAIKQVFAYEQKHIQPFHELIRSVCSSMPDSSKLSRVFMSAHFCLPFGPFFQKPGLNGRPSTAAKISLLVSFQSQINRPACQNCIDTWRPRITKHGEHVSYPFTAWTSAPDVENSVCSNCICHGKKDTCSRATFGGYYKGHTHAADDDPSVSAAHGFSGHVQKGGLDESLKDADSRTALSWDANLPFQPRDPGYP